MLRRLRRYRPWLALLLLGCGHSDPFSPAANGSTAPLAAGEPSRLTYDGGADLTPTWRPDGSAFLYGFEQADPPHTQPDRCLGLMPPTGGRRLGELCNRAMHAADSIDRFEEPSILPDGRVEYLRSASVPFRGPAYFQARVGPFDAAAPASALGALPYNGADGVPRDALTHVTWLSNTDAIGVAGVRGSYVACNGCAARPFIAGRELVRLTIGGSATPLTGPDSVTSAAVASAEGAIYFTRGGDSHVYRVALAGGAPVPVLDLGAAGIARDVQVRGTTAYVVVGGKVSVLTLAPEGRVQLDDGGVIYRADLAAGAAQEFAGGADSRFYRRLALAPSGTALLAEGMAVTVTFALTAAQTVIADTTVGSADIWRFGQP